MEKLLDYADADDVINEESEDLDEKLENLAIKSTEDHIPEIFTMDEDCKLDEEALECKEINNSLLTSQITASIQTNLTNGFDKDQKSKSPLITNTEATTNKENTPTSSASSSSSTLSSQSPAPSSLAVSKDAANNLQNKFNGFLQSPTATTTTNEKEHLLSSSLKSNSSSIIGSALAGHFSTYRQHWNGSRSSVSAVENAMQPSSAAAAQHPSLHLRHSFSTASNYRLRECGDTLSSVLRNSVNTCSKDTLIFLDQQQHHHHAAHRHHHHHSLMEDDDDSTFMGSRSLWVSC